MWHEIGHYFDEARYHGGRGQVNALYTTGKYSSPNKEILQKHTDYINKDRIVPEIAISVRYKGERFKDLNDLIKAKDVDSAFKEKIKYIVAKREAKLQDYLKQRIELFADGFANYVENRSLIRKEAPELARIYDDVFKDREELKDFFTQVNTTKNRPSVQDKSKHPPQASKTKLPIDQTKAGKSDLYRSQKKEVDLSKPRSVVLDKNLSRRSILDEKKEGYRATKSSKPPSNAKAVYRAKLDIKIDLSAVGINEDSIIEEQNRVLKKLIEKGINVDDFTPIEIKYHNHVNTTKKGIKNKRYCVTLPRVGGQYKFRREVSKSVVRATLDNLKKQRPDAYAKVEADFKPSYQTTQKALVSYLKNSRDKKRGAKASVLKRWGKFSPLYGSKLKPVSFGSVDNTRRPDWQTELAGIVAEIQRKGFKKAKARYLQQRGKALASYSYLIREMKSSPMGLLKLSLNHRRKRERAKARIKATNEMVKKD